MLQGNASRLKKVLRVLGAVGLTCAAVRPAGAPLAPLGVCEVLRGLASLEGKAVPVLGRYSYRENGRWMSEQMCLPAAPAPPELWLLESSADGPMPPRDYEIDAVVLKRKRIEMERHRRSANSALACRITTAGRSSMAASSRAKAMTPNSLPPTWCFAAAARC